MPHLRPFERFHSITSVLPAALESDAWVSLSSAAHSLKGLLTHGRTATWRVRACVWNVGQNCAVLPWHPVCSGPVSLGLISSALISCQRRFVCLCQPFSLCLSKTEGRCMGRGPVLAQTKSTSCDDLSKTPRTQQHQRWSLVWLHANRFLELHQGTNHPTT